MSSEYHAIKRAVREALKQHSQEDVINVNLVETESMKIADSAGNIINPATRENQESMVASLQSIDGKITTCDTDDVVIKDSTKTNALEVDSYGRAAVAKKPATEQSGYFDVLQNSSASATITVNAKERVSVWIRCTDGARAGYTGRLIFMTEVGVGLPSVWANPAPIKRNFVSALQVEFSFATSGIRIFVKNYHSSIPVRVEWRVVAW